MFNKRSLYLLVSVMSVFAILLSACGTPAAAPTAASAAPTAAGAPAATAVAPAGTAAAPAATAVPATPIPPNKSDRSHVVL